MKRHDPAPDYVHTDGFPVVHQQVDALLIAGDLFNSSRVSIENVTAAFSELSRLGIPVVAHRPAVGENMIDQKGRERDQLPEIQRALRKLESVDEGSMLLAPARCGSG